MLAHQAADVGALSWFWVVNNDALEVLSEGGSMYALQKPPGVVSKFQSAMIESKRVCANHWQTTESWKMEAVAGEGRWQL